MIATVCIWARAVKCGCRQPGPGYVGATNAFDLGNTTFPTSRSGLTTTRQRSPKTGKRVAIVGAGPAGLSCAHDLALLGHEVTILDSAPLAGGMLRLGIPCLSSAARSR